MTFPTLTATSRDLLLIGGGHSHALLLREIRTKPLLNARVTVVSESETLAYSGMLPGHVAGSYQASDIQIDLRWLAREAAAPFVEATVVGLDLKAKRALLQGGKSLPFDLCSLNIGGAPRPADVPGAKDHAVAAKPIAAFLQKIAQIEAVVQEGVQRMALVGAGAGGVELTLALAKRFAKRVALTLIGMDEELVPGFPAAAREKLMARLREEGIETLLGAAVQRVESKRAILTSGRVVPFDHLLWVSGVEPPAWLKTSGLAVDEKGFVKVDETLRSVSHDCVFAAGDVAVMVGHPRPRAGVFAVRAAEPLLVNLSASLAGEALRPYRPQASHLSLITLGNGEALAVKAGLATSGRSLQILKERIDRSFMNKFRK